MTVFTDKERMAMYDLVSGMVDARLSEIHKGYKQSLDRIDAKVKALENLFDNNKHYEGIDGKIYQAVADLRWEIDEALYS